MLSRNELTSRQLSFRAFTLRRPHGSRPNRPSSFGQWLACLIRQRARVSGSTRSTLERRHRSLHDARGYLQKVLRLRKRERHEWRPSWTCSETSPYCRYLEL